MIALGYPTMPDAADAMPAILPFSPTAVEGMDARIVDVVRRTLGDGAVPDLPAGEGWVFVELTDTDAGRLAERADALVAAGYYGKSENSNIKIAADAGAKGTKVPSLKLEGVHLCCNQCVSAVDKAVKSVAGVKEHTATRNASSFEVKGDFEDKAVIQALHDAGLAAKVGGNQ